MNQTRTKLLSLAMMALLACAMVSLVACSDSADPNAEDTPEEVVTTAVVYYSATGTTQGIADMVAGAADGVPFAINPVMAYTDADLDYDDPESRVSQERESSERNIELVMDAMPGWDSYDVVFIGYPIWWGEAAWPMQSFVQANNFSGKKVIPFCTSESSGIGTSAEQLAELTRTGNWLPGGSFNAATTQAEINEWVASLELGSDAEEESGAGTAIEA